MPSSRACRFVAPSLLRRARRRACLSPWLRQATRSTRCGQRFASPQLSPRRVVVVMVSLAAVAESGVAVAVAVAGVVNVAGQPVTQLVVVVGMAAVVSVAGAVTTFIGKEGAAREQESAKYEGDSSK